MDIYARYVGFITDACCRMRIGILIMDKSSTLELSISSNNTIAKWCFVRQTETSVSFMPWSNQEDAENTDQMPNDGAPRGGQRHGTTRGEKTECMNEFSQSFIKLKWYELNLEGGEVKNME